MTKEKRWTLCSKFTGRLKTHCQYKDRAKAEAHAKSNGKGWFVRLMPVNPQRVAIAGGRRSCAVYIKVGLPQY